MTFESLARSRRSRKNIFERKGPDPAPTIVLERTTASRTNARIQYPA